jgi:hypothetical protein
VKTAPAPSDAAGPTGAGPAALEALLAVLRPLARLALARGVPFGELEELLKRAMVEEAARGASGESPGGASRAVSRLSVSTGIHRKEVKRLLQDTRHAPQPVERSYSSELFTRWISDPTFRDRRGRARTLPRKMPPDGAPSFEALARSVTTDVHPRTLLEELRRLDVVAFDPAQDTVSLKRDAFVPSRELSRVLAFLGANVGDHLAAAVANVEASIQAAGPAGDPPPPPFVEQAVFADELSEASVAVAGARAREAWAQLLKAIAPELQRLIDEDRAAGRAQNQRIRIGLYSFSEPDRPRPDPKGPSS